MRYAQVVIGPAGSGKSTYCSFMQRHAQDSKRVIEVVNLDPAAEHFDYQPLVDIRDLIQLDDAMDDEELHYGPNGGLVFCLEFLIENQEWLKNQLCGGGDEEEDGLNVEPDDDYILFDMPGQIELFTHLNMGKQLVQLLESWNFRICTVFLVDSQFMIDGAKFLSGTMAALSVMANLEMPHVNVLTKMDLLSKTARKQLDKYLDPDPRALLGDVTQESAWGRSHRKLSEAIGSLIEDFSLSQEPQTPVPKKKKKTSVTSSWTYSSINAVEEHPCVWEYSIPDYKDRNKREQAWRDIKENCPGHTVEDCKAKWANVKTAFQNVKKKNKAKSGQGAENIQPHWPHWTAMQFYNQHYTSKSSSSVSTLDVEETQPGCSIHYENILLVVTPAIDYMKTALQPLKVLYPNMIYVNCLLQSYQKMLEYLQIHFTQVDTFINSCEAVFSKSPHHQHIIRTKYNNLNLPAISDRSCTTKTWLKTVLYYHNNFKEIKALLEILLQDDMRFVPMNVDDEESIQDLLLQIDNVIQYGEDADVKVHDFDPPEEEENDNVVTGDVMTRICIGATW
ncbi:hypothetical protein FF38_04613 [Lucilia cuprina]|uniref:GPN-loop GTPase 3 n=1 Tax=Lucilia cuprina TaxID=7375 RepID=A0A0L0BYL9_LUCCU|nr:hypothetical protein FF38_04613 [Lucilia cuprina]